MGRLAGDGMTAEWGCICQGSFEEGIDHRPPVGCSHWDCIGEHPSQGSGPLQGLLLQRYDAWTDRPLKDIIKGLQTLINLTGEHPKLKQVAVVKGMPVDSKKIPH